jgi:hypothetical protein
MKKSQTTNNKSNSNTTNSTNNQQKTLFQFWNKQKSNLENKTDFFDLNEIANLDLEEEISNNNFQQNHINDGFKKPHKIISSNNSNKITTIDSSNSMLIENDDDDTDSCTVGLDEQSIKATQNFQCEGFDVDAGSIWIYPNNMPIRCYQYNIIEQCLHKNTMVIINMNVFFLINNFICNKILFIGCSTNRIRYN